VPVAAMMPVRVAIIAGAIPARIAVEAIGS